MEVLNKTILVTLLAGLFCFLPRTSINAQELSSNRKARMYLVGSDFSTWQGNNSQWQTVGDVFTNPQNEKLLSSKPGTGVIMNGPNGKTVNLISKNQWQDVKAHIEFMVPKGSNSGVYFMGRYEIQVFDSWQMVPEYPGIECGGIYERWDENRKPKGFEGHSPRVNASRPPGQWQSFDIIFRAPRFDENGKKISNARVEKVIHNDVIIHEDVVLTGPTRSSAYNDEKPVGPLMLQGDHGPVAYRNIWIEPAGPNPFFAMDTATQDDKHRTPKEYVEVLKELGYDGIGISYAGCNELSEVIHELDRNSLRLFTVYLEVNIDPDHQKYDPKLPDAIQILQGHNTILWLVVTSQRYEPSTLEGDAGAAEIIREVADMAAKAKVRVALYPHYGFWLERVEDAVRLAEKVNRPNVGMTFNLCHWLRVNDERDIRPLLKLAMPYLFVVTISGADIGSKDWKDLIKTLDQGSFNVRDFLKTLKDCGYTGPIGLQGYGTEGDVYENLKRSINAWRGMSQHLIP